MHWLVSTHATHAPSLVQWGVRPLHWVSLVHTTQVLCALHTRFMPQFASPMHSTQYPRLVAQYGVAGGQVPSPEHASASAGTGPWPLLLHANRQHAITTWAQRLIR